MHGIDAAQHREVERDEVAEQDERDEPLERGVAGRRDAGDVRGARAGLVGGELGAQDVARVRGRVVEEDRGEGAEASFC